MRGNHQYKYVAFLAAFLMVAAESRAEQIAADKSAAVIFAYQRVGEDALPHGSISADRFISHIDELKTEGYEVLSIPDIIDALREGRPLPHKAIGITFEGAYNSTRINAFKRLDEAKIPYTVFFNSDLADQQAAGHMGWNEIKALSKNKLVTLGILPSAYVHMPDLTPAQNAALINKAVARYKEELGETPAFFAYPYGEYSAVIRKDMENYSFRAAFGQQSGVAHAKSDFLALPRFTMTDAYGDLDRFLLTANALPLPVTDMMPENMVVSAVSPEKPVIVGFTVTPEISDLSKLSCFVSGSGKTDLTRLGNRVEIRLTEAFVDRNTRINCTIPDETVIPGEPQSWRWLGMQLVDSAFREEEITDTTNQREQREQ